MIGETDAADQLIGQIMSAHHDDTFVRGRNGGAAMRLGSYLHAKFILWYDFRIAKSISTCEYSERDIGVRQGNLRVL
jgi:hypothetical protein